MVKVVAVFGLSGVGKTWLISRYAVSSEALHVQASQLLRQETTKLTGEAVTNEGLRKGAVLDNQSLLVQAFSKVAASATKPIIFDGHCVVDTGDRLIEIPSGVIKALLPSGIVFVHDRAAAIVARRAGDIARARLVRSEGEIELQQERAVAVCRDYAKELGLGLHFVEAGDEAAFGVAISSALAE